MREIKSFEEMGEELCDYCPLEEQSRGVHSYGGEPDFCEDSGACKVAYDTYLDSIIYEHKQQVSNLENELKATKEELSNLKQDFNTKLIAEKERLNQLCLDIQQKVNDYIQSISSRMTTDELPKCNVYFYDEKPLDILERLEIGEIEIPSFHIKFIKGRE